jgi:hypothetical protein
MDEPPPSITVGRLPSKAAAGVCAYPAASVASSPQAGVASAPELVANKKVARLREN